MVKSASIPAARSSYTNFEAQLLATLTEWASAIAIAVATGVVVIWQNWHVAVLWDLTYTLDNSYRMALGEAPYRDFPFVHPPLTFLMQAAIIKFTGRVYWHHVAYCAIASAVATILTWRIMRGLLAGVANRKIIALVLTLPLVPLGIYCVFPHPFYDPDCTLAILISLLLLLWLDQHPRSITLPILAGISLVVPLFIKQNIGLPFLLTTIVLTGALLIWQKWKGHPARPHTITIAAALLTVAVGILLIHRTAGLGNYWHWTIQFAGERRTPARQEMLDIYAAKKNLLWLTFIAGVVFALWFSRARRRVWRFGAPILLAAPFVWPTIYLLFDSDASERADRLIDVWPVLLIVSVIAALLTIRRRRGMATILPFVILAAIHGCFLSQQLWGSTYGIWPLFMILFAMTLVSMTQLFSLNPRQQEFDRLEAGLVPPDTERTSPSSKQPDELERTTLSSKQPAGLFEHVPLYSQSADWAWLTLPLATVTALSLLVAGGFYVRSHERLSYANLDEGELRHASLPSLKGLSTRGDWIPNLEELVRFAKVNIPPGDGILLLPDEDAFYYATGRRPQFPVLLFDHTVNPYSPEQIRTICRDRNIQWLVVKQDLQNEDDAVDQEKEQIAAALEDDFEHVEELSNYDVYRRIDPNAKKDSDDDNDDDDNDDSGK